MNKINFNFPLFIKNDAGTHCIISRKECITLTRDSQEIRISHKAFEYSTVSAFEQYMDGEMTVITEEEFSKQFEFARDFYDQKLQQINYAIDHPSEVSAN